MGFIPEFTNFILEAIPTSPDWAESIATSLVSTVSHGKHIRNRMGTLDLNVWFMFLGPSGLAYKSLPLRTFLFPVLKRISELSQYDLILPTRFSIEGMIKHMSGHNSGCIARDELTGIFKEAYNKQYLADLLEFLSELYDGLLQKRFTIRGQLEQVLGCYVTFIGATTPYIFKVMKPEFYTQGTGNRIMPIVFMKPQNVEIEAKNFFLTKEAGTSEAQIDFFARRLLKIRESQVNLLIPMEDASQLWTDFKVECDAVANKRFKENMYDVLYMYVVRMPEMALKLSGIYALSTNCDFLRPELEEILIMRDHMEWGIAKARRHLEHFKEMLKLWGTRPEPMTAWTLEEQTNAVLTLLEKTPEGLMWSELRGDLGWRINTWSEVLEYLFDTERIFVVLASSENRGPRPVKFYHIGHKVRANGEELDYEGLRSRIPSLK